MEKVWLLLQYGAHLIAIYLASSASIGLISEILQPETITRLLLAICIYLIKMVGAVGLTFAVGACCEKKLECIPKPQAQSDELPELNIKQAA